MGVRGLTEAWNPEDGADPTTCRHNVVKAGFAGGMLIPFIQCVSCGFDLSDYIMRVGKNYEWDEEHKVYVHKPKEKKQ